jgi:HEAT repeat protein
MKLVWVGCLGLLALGLALAGLAPQKAAVAVPVLATNLEDKDAEVRRGAAYVLGEIGPPAKDAVPALTRALKDDKADVRQAAGWALERFGAPK